MRNRISFIADQLSDMKPDAAAWIPQNYPHLHTPLSSSVVLQWTLRNGSLVNLPWALLVEGDVILIKPGQVKFEEKISPLQKDLMKSPVEKIANKEVLLWKNPTAY